MKNNTVRFYELFCYVSYISGNQIKLSLWLFFLTKLKNKRIQCSGTITKKFKENMLWHFDFWCTLITYICVCVCLQSENGSDSVYSLKFTTWKSECTADSSKPWTDCDYLQSGSKVTIISSSSHLTTRGMKILKFLLNALVKTKPSHGLSCPSRGRFLATPPSSCQRQRLRQSRWTARLVSEGEQTQHQIKVFNSPFKACFFLWVFLLSRCRTWSIESILTETSF